MKINKNHPLQEKQDKHTKKTNILSSLKECKKMQWNYSSTIKVEAKVQIPLKHGFAQIWMLMYTLLVFAWRMIFPPIDST